MIVIRPTDLAVSVSPSSFSVSVRTPPSIASQPQYVSVFVSHSLFLSPSSFTFLPRYLFVPHWLFLFLIFSASSHPAPLYFSGCLSIGAGHVVKREEKTNSAQQSKGVQ